MLQTLDQTQVKILQHPRTFDEIRPERSHAKNLAEKGKLVGHWCLDEQGKLYCHWFRE